MCVFVINVYSKCKLIDKRALWLKFNNVNSRLFHAFVQCRQKERYLDSKIGETWIEGIYDIR